MKKLFLILLIFLFAACSTNSPDFKNSIKIIPMETNFDLSSSISQPEIKPFIDENDIEYYDWENHTIYITEDALTKIKNDKRELLTKEFYIQVNDEILYTGRFWSFIFSSICEGPVINIFQDNSGKYSLMDDKIVIENGYHAEDSDWDPRSNQKLFNALMENHQLK